MIKNFIITAWRNLKTQKFFSLINTFGLSVGLTSCMLIGAYLYTELNYDTYSVYHKQLYRVILTDQENNSAAVFPSVDIAVGPGIANAFPGVKAFTRLSRRGPVFVKYGENDFKEQHIAIADSNFLQLFSIPLIAGNTNVALKEPNSLVISEAFKTKYFGNSPALGKMITIGNELMKVTGIIDKVPDNSHFHADAFISLATYDTPATKQTWSNVGEFTYLLLDKNTDPKKLEAQFPQLVAKHVVPEIQHDMGVSLSEAQKSVNTFVFSLQPLTDIHLHSNTKYEFEANGDIRYVFIFSALALFILVLACINFTNLSTASSVRRSKEIGIRKVLGSEKGTLISQFLTESILLTFIAMALALGLVYLLLPYFNNLSGKHIAISYFFNYKTVIAEVLLAVLVGSLAGVYPAFFLSSFKIIQVLKGSSFTPKGAGNSLRSGLIVMQFAISTSLIIATFVVYQQLHFMQNKKLGYNKNQLLVLSDTYTLGNNVQAFEQQLLNDKRVVSGTVSSSVPGYNDMGGTEVYASNIGDNNTHASIQINIYWIQHSYIPTMEMHLSEGRNFYPSAPADSSSVILNQTAVKALGFADIDPIGKTLIRSGQRHYTVVGVVKDFNYTSAKNKVGPLMMLASDGSVGNIILRINTKNIPQLISDIKKQWETYNTGAPFNYSFLDDQFASLYSTEQHTGQIFTSFSIIAVIIACLGLFGLAAFVIRQRVKEIGVRKVLGASSAGITVMLSKQFLKLVLIAVVIAFPLTWLAMSKWLQAFAYRVDMHWWVFVVSGFIAFAVAALTVSFQSVKASLANPVRNLRSE